MNRTPLCSSVLALVLLAQVGISVVPPVQAQVGDAPATIALGQSQILDSVDYNRGLAKLSIACPAGFAAVQAKYKDAPVNGSNSDNLTSVGIRCRRVLGNGTLGEWTGWIETSNAGSVSREWAILPACGDNEVLVRFVTKDLDYGNPSILSNDGVDGIDPVCQTLRITGLTGGLQYVPLNKDLTPKEGRNSRPASAVACYSQTVMTGVTIDQAGNLDPKNRYAVDAVRVRCAPFILTYVSGSSSSSSSAPYFPCSFCSVPPNNSSSSAYSSHSYSSANYNHNNTWLWNWANNQQWNWGN